MKLKVAVIYLFVACLFLLCAGLAAQDATVVLNQGTVVGLKVFPETSKTAVLTFLGIPYADPPTKRMRFSPPQPHKGWNHTLFARNFRSICPQLQNNFYEPSQYTERYDEDCLYINIWTPESALRYGNVPVVVAITGEDMSFDWSHNRPTGLDLAAEGVVVVTVQYRTNIFGWLSLDSPEAPGNLGLRDQVLAFKWIQANIFKFGGDANQMTVLGHGTSGAALAMIHLTSPQTKGVFNRAILMSGTVFSSYAFQVNDKIRSVSSKLIKILACDFMNHKFTLECLKTKSTADLMKAFESIYQNGNYTLMLGPQLDDYLESGQRYVPVDPRKVLIAGTYDRVPIIIGICSNEGAFIRDHWIDLGRQGYKHLKQYVTNTLIPNVLRHYGYPTDPNSLIQDLINWKFFDDIPKTSPNLLNAMFRLISESKFETPFYQTIDVLLKNELQPGEQIISVNTSGNSTAIFPNTIPAEKEAPESSTKQQDLYVFSFQHPNSMDMRGKVNFFGGASHSSDLLFLMGPSLFQQIGRRHLTQFEDKLCKEMRLVFTNFIKTSNPTPGRYFDAWKPFTSTQRAIKILGGSQLLQQGSDEMVTTFEKNYQKIVDLLEPPTSISNEAPVNPYNIGDAYKFGGNDRDGKIPSYLTGTQSTAYAEYLVRVNSFWTNLLPKINKHLSEHKVVFQLDAQGREIQKPEQDTPKFKHAFISMLCLVLFLLAVLGVCVYIFKRSNKDGGASFL